MTRTQKFIEKYKKVLVSGSNFFNPDTSLMPIEAYYKAKCRILVIFSSPNTVKTVSSTASALNDYVITNCPDCFIDFAYIPEGQDIKLYDDNLMPWAIGNITHLDPSYYDYIGFSISVLNEIVTAPVIIKTFERCDNPIPLFWSDRKDAKIGTYPIIQTGGITAICGDLMYGDVKTELGNKTSFIDFAYLGSCEKQDIVWKRFIEAKETGKVTRTQKDHYIPGTPNEDYVDFEEVLNVTTTQDFIDSLFDLQNIYQPQAYKVVYNKYNRIIENTKINKKAQDFVVPYYPHELSTDLGIGRTIINANGDATGTTQTQVSEGCSAGGHCSFAQARGTRVWTNDGIKKIEDLVGTNPYVQAIEAEKCQNILQIKTSEVFKVRLNSGHYSRGDKNHKFMVFENGNLIERRLFDLKKGDVVFRKLGSNFDYNYKEDDCGNIFDEKKAELLGFVHGDGHFCKRESNNHNKMWYLFTREGEEHYVELFKELCGFDKEPSLIYESEKTEGVRVYCSCKSVDIEKFYNDDLCLNTCDGLRVPEIVFSSPKSVMRAYLRGVLQADGWSNDDCIGLTSISKQFIDDIVILLSFLGYDCSILKNGYLERNPKEGHKVTYQVIIRKYFHEKFRTEIGFECKQINSGSVANWCRATMPRTNELVRLFRSAVSSRQELRDKGLGSLYEWVRNDREDNISVNSLRKFKELYPDIELPYFYEKVANSELVPDVISDIESEGIEEEMYDVLNTETHLCVYGTILTHQCAEGAYCLPKGSLIKSGKGLTKIEDFKVGDSVILNNNKYSVLDTVKVGEKPLYSIRLKNNQEQKVANSHLLLTIENGKVTYKRAWDLKQGDFLAYERSESFGPNKTNLGYLVGSIIGDGLFYPDNNLVKIYSPEHEVHDFKKSFEGFSISRHSDSIFTISKNTKELTSKLLKIGLSHQTAKNKSIPEFFFNANKETLISLLQGMFDTDGTIELDKNGRAYLGYSTTSVRLKDDLVRILSMFGINASVYETTHKGHFIREDEWIKESTCYEVSIFGNENIKRFSDIGFRLKSKQEKLNKASLSALATDVIPTFETRIKDAYRNDIVLNRQVRRCNDSLRKIVNGWDKSKFLFRRHFEKSLKYLPEDIKNDYLEASKYEWYRIKSIEEIGTAEMYDINVEDSHAYSMCGWVSHNTGGWVEKPRQQVLDEVMEAKKYSAGYKYKAFSFNMNYYTDYKGLLYDLIARYPKVTFINMRMEELGRDTDAMKIMKLVGSNRISAPMEGLSPRVQNNLLNKCLSEEALDNFMTDIIHLKMSDVKCVVKDTLTPIPDNGLLTQDMLKPFTTEWYGEHEENTIKATFSRGIEIEGTPYHKVLVKPDIKEDNFKELKDLTDKDTVYLRYGQNCYGKEYIRIRKENVCNAYTSIQDNRDVDLLLDESFAEVLGWCLGDGSVESTLTGSKNRVRFYFNSEELDVAKRVKAWLSSMGWFSSENKVKENVICISSFYKNFAYLVESLIGRCAFSKTIPSEILRSPKSVQVAFIRGLMGADGTICNIKKGKNYHSSIAISLSNKKVISVLQQMLLNIGIVSHIRKGKTKCNGANFITYNLVVLQQHHSLYMKEVGFSCDRKDKYKLCGRIQKGTRDSIKEINGFIPVKLVSKENSVAPVYKFQVEGHVYDTNSVVSHNCGAIFTAWEQDEDFQYVVDMVQRYKKIAEAEGGSFNFRLKATPLVHYNLTALEYLERKSAKKSYFGEHWLTDEWYEKFRENDVFFKVNGFRYSTFVEQSIVDLGRNLTQLVYDEFVKTTSPVFSLRSVTTPSFLEKLKLLVNPYEGKDNLTEEEQKEKDKYIEGHFGSRNPESYISPSHRIHIDLMGSYIERARSLVECADKGNVFDNPENIRCLKTYDGAKTRCYRFVAKKRPLKIYKDVKLIDGKLNGDFRLLLGCERCKTDCQRTNRLSRKNIQTKTSADVISAPRLQKNSKIRFTIYRNPEYDVLNPNNTAHTFLTKFLQASDKLLNSYHSIESHSMQWQSRPECSYFVSGYQIVDTLWSSDVFDEVKNLIDNVNSQLKTVKIISATKEFIQDIITTKDYNVVYFESTLPYELFESSKYNYNGDIRIYNNMGSEKIEDNSLSTPIYTVVDKVYGIFKIPVKYNPVEYLLGYLGSSKRINMKKLLETTTFSNLLTVGESSAPCKICNNSAMVSLVSGKILPFCSDCMLKSLLSMKIKNLSK